MSDYTNYVESVNKIFEYLNQMKSKWTAQDNINYINKIEDYKTTVIDISKVIKEKDKEKIEAKEINNDR